MSELKPCPFCGSTDVANVSGNYAGPSNRLHAGDEIFAVNCKSCGASVPNRYRNELVVEAWNRRTQPAPGTSVEVPRLTDEEIDEALGVVSVGSRCDARAIEAALIAKWSKT